MLDLRINTDDLDAEKNISNAAKEAAEGFNDLGTGLDHLNSKWDGITPAYAGKTFIGCPLDYVAHRLFCIFV